jgi:hypothetical protein
MADDIVALDAGQGTSTKDIRSARVPGKWEILRRLTKTLTIWAYNNGHLSFGTTERIFAQIDLRDI